MRLLHSSLAVLWLCLPPGVQGKPTLVGSCPFDQLADNQGVFNSDVYGGRAYERGVMAYGSREKGGGWWSVQNEIRNIVGDEMKKRQGAGAKVVTILDVGSGPGFTLNEIKGLAPTCCPGLQVVSRGIEYNDKMVSYSRAAYGVDVKQGDMHQLSSLYAPGSLDIINAQSVLWASDRPEVVAKEIGKVQKPGGLLTFTWMVRRKNEGGQDNYASWFNAFSAQVNQSVAEGRIGRAEADGVLAANGRLVTENNINSPRDPEELITLFKKEGYELEKQLPQYPDEQGKPFFYQYVFRKKK